MGIMTNLEHIENLCNGSVMIYINPHKDDCMIVEQYFQNYADRPVDEILFKMVELDSIIWIHANYKYPIKAHSVFHYDLESAINEMFELLRK